MKSNQFVVLTFILFLSLIVKAQDFSSNHDKWMKNWTNFEPNTTNYPQAEEKLPTIIADDLYLTNNTTYLLSGDVYVTSGATLTIQEGTVLRCDHANPANLIIAKGSKLIAAGSEAYPIVFTSNKAAKSRAAGDWGGIIIAGSGKVNTVAGNGVIKGNLNPQFSVYGGNNYEEQTTIMRYVRIEFSGNKRSKNNDSHGLSLFGLGTSSIVDNVMVSYSGQDSFHISGGQNNLTNLISYKAEDDDFEITEGFKGNFDQVIAVRHPYITSPRGSYAIEIDGYNKELGYLKSDAITNVAFTNATLVNLSDKSNYIHTTAAISAKNAAQIYLHNSKISGFSDVVSFNKAYTSLAMIEKAFQMDNSFFNIHGEGVKVGFKPNTGALDILKYNRFTQEFVSVDTLFENPDNPIAPKFNLKKSLNTYMVMQ